MSRARQKEIEYQEAAKSPEERPAVQVIARAAAVLRALKAHPDGLSLGELAKLLALPRSTVQRIVDALHAENLVIAASLARGVRLGPALLPLAAAAKFGFVDIARPTLQHISRECGETVDLSLLDADKVVFVDQVRGTHRLRAESDVGISFPLHSSAPGKAMLAAVPKDELEHFREVLRLGKLTPRTIDSWTELDAALAEIRRSGISSDLEENAEGICAIAASLRLPTGEFAAISIPVPTQRFMDIRGQLEALLLEQCDKLQQRL
ncbi:MULTISPECIES: IclR family transcriptional regulator [Burkholderia]|uniref:IclR family transcriptional regulator n=1 Tax=Burkholderia aenigmatica TaxID=2015348 RepID=A0A6J5IQ83_9BURK|nr:MULTISPECIES: IclR family transcriptional regulator [Burkholderia]CAB3961895.1 IclR family transcriptional regulator [Burkholderia aenigmatica]VWC66947.1 IclR family transcriptional regulator [Burkholderia aenigmatica]VWC91277.1 IclR family transcriptional regulator [Burkholderia aenigmatica]